MCTHTLPANVRFLLRWERIWRQWLYLERNTPQTECGPSQTARKRALKFGVVSFYRLGNFHRLMSEMIIPIILGKGQGFPPLFGFLWLVSELSQHWWVSHLDANVLQ